MLSLKEIKPQYITNETGKKTAVIIPISDFEVLMADMRDLVIVAERRDEPSITHEDLKKELSLN